MVEFVVTCVDCLTREHDQVVRMVVPLIRILMMHNLTTFEWPSQHGLSHDAMNVSPILLEIRAPLDRPLPLTADLASHALVLGVGMKLSEFRASRAGA